MSMLFAYMAGVEGVGGWRFLNVLSEGVRIFSTCFVGVRGQVQYLSFREKNNRPPPINK